MNEMETELVNEEGEDDNDLGEEYHIKLPEQNRTQATGRMSSEMFGAKNILR